MLENCASVEVEMMNGGGWHEIYERRRGGIDPSGEKKEEEEC